MVRLSKVFLICVVVGLAAQFAQADEAEIFDRLDANTDGQVTKDEVSQEQMRLFERLLRRSDKNEDGKLSKEEFVAGTTGKPDEATGPSASGQPQRPQFNPQQLLNRLDRNGDKKITK